MQHRTRMGIMCSMAAGFVLAATTPMVGAGDPGVPPIYVEEPGVQEFSGELIGRPIQDERGEQGRRMILDDFDVITYEPLVDYYVFRVPAGETENTVAQHLMATGAFEYVEPNWTVYPAYTPNDPRLGDQWSHTRIQSRQAWDYHTGHSGITVAICDTGLRTTHEDLPPHRKEGYNAVDQRWENQGGAINDIHGHGTHVTGIAAAMGNNGRGVAGMTWNASHRIMRVSNSSGGGSSIAILNHAALTAAQQGDQVINTSYSGVNNASVRTTAQTIRNLGGLSFWAAGNSNQNMTSPHRDNDALMVVGSTTSSDARSSFSNFGAYVDLFAPGSDILSTTRTSDSSYGNMSGTSMASPLAAGLAALIWSQNPNFTSAQIEQIMKSTCDNIGDPNVFGYGRINARRAMEAAARRTVGSTFMAGNGHNGAMFDITATNPKGVTITGFDFNWRGSSTSADLEVWYVSNLTTYVGKETNQSAWTRLGSVSNVAARPVGAAVPINIGQVSIPAGRTVGFYVTRTDGESLSYTNGPTQAYASPDLRWENRGVGKEYPFGTTFANRIFNGAVHYRIGTGRRLPALANASGNFVPFGNNQTVTMHQVFDRNLFGGAATIESLGFATMGPIGDPAQFSLTIRLGYSDKIPGQTTGNGGLDANLSNNPNGPMTTVFSSSAVRRNITGNGSEDSALQFSITPFNFNPSNGNLLVEMVVTNNSSADVLISRANGSSQASRAWDSTRFANQAQPNQATRIDFGYTAPAPFRLTVTGPCPSTVTTAWSGANPNGEVALLFAANTGRFVIPFGPCQGTVLGLGTAHIQLVGRFPSGSTGSGSRTFRNAHPASCGRFLQMHDIPRCETTNVAVIP